MTKEQVYAALHMYKKQIYNIAKELKIDFTIDDSIKLIVYKIIKQTKSSITLQNVLKYCHRICDGMWNLYKFEFHLSIN